MGSWMSRRRFLKSTATTLSSLFVSQPAFSTPPRAARGIKLSDEHNAAVRWRRRIVVQDDPNNFDPHDLLGIDFERWLAYRFNYADQLGSQIDGFCWDIGFGENQAVYRSGLLRPVQIPGLQKWRDQGIDLVEGLVQACRKRKLEVFWNHRVNEIDRNADGNGSEMNVIEPIKKAHPDWLIRSWWWQGLWNYAIPDARNYRLQILTELASSYEFDGIQLDFSRHVPCLPPGHQWELREGVTEYVRQARMMLLELEKKRGRPYLLSVKIPESLQGCRIDGFDVEVWARENLIDVFTLGDRSIDIDLAAFRSIVSGKNIMLQPCLDDHHATDGYKFPSVDFFRGVFGNWWRQGANSVMTFNWSCAPPEVANRIGSEPGPKSHGLAYQCVGSIETLRYKDELFVVQRRGGYPWSEGYFNRNDFAQLPVDLANEGTPVSLTIDIRDQFESEMVKNIALSLILYGAYEGDSIKVTLNGSALESPKADLSWKDPQIFSPNPQPSSGRNFYRIDPDQRLMKLEFSARPAFFHVGHNEVNVYISERKSFPAATNIRIEKLEVLVQYTAAPLSAN